MGDKKINIRCRGIIFHDGKLFVVKHPHDTSFVALPGGHLEFGEDIKECPNREIIEELGIKPEIGRLLYINNFFDKNENKQSIEFFFEIKNSKNYLDVSNIERTHAKEISEMIWIDPTQEIKILPEKLNNDFRAGLIFLDEIRYIYN